MSNLNIRDNVLNFIFFLTSLIFNSPGPQLEVEFYANCSHKNCNRADTLLLYILLNYYKYCL